MTDTFPIATTPHGRFRCDPDDHIGRVLHAGAHYEASFLQAVLRKVTRADSVCVDAGAYIGTWTVALAMAYPAGRVYAFEPNPGPFGLLEENVALNACQGVTAKPWALGARRATGTLATPDPGNAGHTVLSPGAGVEVWPLDALGLRRLDFLKVDVEGMEEDVIRGGAETLQRCRPAVLVEHGHRGATSVLFALGYTTARDISKYTLVTA